MFRFRKTAPFLLLVIFTFAAYRLEAQTSGAILELIKRVEGNITDVQAGETFTYILQYRCVNITQPCENVVVTDVLPPQLSRAAADVTLIGSVHTLSQTYNPATGTARWVFVSPLPAGSTGELKLNVKFPEGFTAEGTLAVNTAQIDASNSGGIVNSNDAVITAHAQNRLFASKQVFGGVLDTDTTYIVEFCRPANIQGQLNMTGITMVDMLPTGSTYVASSHGGVYNAGPPQTVTWSLPDFIVTDDLPCISRTVTVRFESANGWSLGDNISNTAVVTGTPIGETSVATSSVTVNHQVVGAQPQSQFSKLGNRTEASWGDTVRYGFQARNTGNVPLSSYVISDVVPDQINVTQVHSGSGASAQAPVIIRYQTNLNPVWTNVAGSPFTTPRTVNLSFPAGEYVTQLQWDFGTIPPGHVFSQTNAVNNLPGYSGQVLQVDRQGNTVTENTVISNTARVNYEYGGTPFTSASTFNITVTLPSARPSVRKNIESGSPANPGDIILYRLRIGNLNPATFDLVNPMVADLLDSDVEFVAWGFNPNNTGNTPPPAPMPLFEQIDDYNGTGRTLLRWHWAGAAAYRFTTGEEAHIFYQARVKPGTPAGANRVVNRAYVASWDVSVPRATCPTFATDTLDLDGDGDTTELICISNQVSATVNAQAVMESAKWVKGDLDTDWQRFPRPGFITPGGIFEYRLDLRNMGNVSTTNIEIIDILPHLGDTGVIDLSLRNSQWKATLIEPVVVPPGVTVFYSVESNPCRPQLVPTGPPGCTPPNWTNIPPVDLADVQALRFDLGSFVLTPLSSFEIIWRMRAPTDVRFGEVSWNSFGYVARRVDNGQLLLPSEPLKVGMTVRPAPLSGVKAYVTAYPPEIEWKLLWINNRNAFPVNAEVIDLLPRDALFVPGSLSCDARGTSSTAVCEYDAANHRIVWRGRVGPDLGKRNENTADNELVITFRFGVYGDTAAYTNIARATVDSNNDGSLSDEPPSSTSDTNAAVGGIGFPDNSAAAAALLVPGSLSDLVLSKIASAFFAMPGALLEWTITVTNDEPFPVDNIVVVDTVPDILEVLSASASSGSVSIKGQTVTLTLSTLGVGQRVVITVQTRIRPNAPLPFILENEAELRVSGNKISSAGSRVLSVNQLPSTGQSPWRVYRVWLALGTAAVLLGMGRFIRKRITL